jgi:hypothetical protein
VRLRVQFRKNIRGRSINVLENALRKIETNDEWRVEIRSWVDTEGVCGVGFMQNARNFEDYRHI